MDDGGTRMACETDAKVPKVSAKHVLLAAMALSMPAQPASGQHPFTPGVAFGADVFPYLDGGRDSWALQFDLFSELSKDLDSNGQFLVYNDIDRTIGVNQLGRTWVLPPKTLIGTLNWHPTLWASGGVVWDAPVEFLQNDVAHGLRLLTYVPRDGVVDHVVLGVGTDQTLSWAKVINPKVDFILAGTAGAGLSTSYVDGYGQLGAELRIGPQPDPWFHVGALGRLGGTADPFYWEGFDAGLGGPYRLVQVWLLLAPGSVFSVPTVPRLRVALMRSRGPFRQAGGASPITEYLWSVRIDSSRTRWSVEMWNDFVFKDLGPTFGLRILWYR
jgi:hypothetical protein